MGEGPHAQGVMTAATTNWPNHYREAEILMNVEIANGKIVSKSRLVMYIIHEICHLVLADLHDYTIEMTPKLMREHSWDIIETAVSEVSNIMTELFMDAHATAIDKYLK